MELVEDVIKETTASSVVRFQNAVTNANSRLNLAISPKLFLMPNELTINTDRVHGYNNVLHTATKQMHFGINDDINTEKHDRLPKHKAPMSPEVKKSHKASMPPILEKKTPPSSSTSHEKNMAAIAIVSAGVGWWLFR